MRPLFIDWAITNKCNLSCIHCTGMMESELDTERALSLVDEIRELEPDWLIIEGGEPFLRADLDKILEKVLKSGLMTYMITNALVIKEEILKRFKDYQNFKILVSFDGATRETYEKIKVGARWDLLHKNLSILKDYSLLHGFTVVLSKLNKSEIEDFLRWGEKYDLKVLVFIPLEPFEPLEKFYDLHLTKDDYIDVMDKVIKFNEEAKIKLFFDEPFFGVYEHLKKSENEKFVNSGIIANKKGCILGDYIYIQTNGDVRPCMFADREFKFGNVNELSLKEIWKMMREDKTLMMAKKKDNRVGVCGSCDFFEMCFGCLARVRKIRGNIFDSDVLCPIPILKFKGGSNPL